MKNVETLLRTHKKFKRRYTRTHKSLASGVEVITSSRFLRRRLLLLTASHCFSALINNKLKCSANTVLNDIKIRSAFTFIAQCSRGFRISDFVAGA